MEGLLDLLALGVALIGGVIAYMVSYYLLTRKKKEPVEPITIVVPYTEMPKPRITGVVAQIFSQGSVLLWRPENGHAFMYDPAEDEVTLELGMKVSFRVDGRKVKDFKVLENDV